MTPECESMKEPARGDCNNHQLRSQPSAYEATNSRCSSMNAALERINGKRPINHIAAANLMVLTRSEGPVERRRRQKPRTSEMGADAEGNCSTLGALEELQIMDWNR